MTNPQPEPGGQPRDYEAEALAAIGHNNAMAEVWALLGIRECLDGIRHELYHLVEEQMAKNEQKEG